METIPAQLKEAIKNDELIVFVGAGLSINLKNQSNEPLGNWKNLVKNILNHLESKEYNVSHLYPLVDRYEPIIVLDLIEKDLDLPKNEINIFAKKFYDLHFENDWSLHKKIFQLSHKIITTNYDTAFEISEHQLRSKKAYLGTNFELTNLKDKNATYLFKLHGCIENVGSMVLFPSKYKSLYKNKKNRDSLHTLSVFKNIIYNKTILFIGFGMGDYQINTIFKEIKTLQGEYNQDHYIITNKSIDSSLNFLKPLTIKEHSEIESILDKLIAYKKECLENEAPETKLLKKQLEAAEIRIKELVNTTDIEKLLEGEANKYFIKGVEHSMQNVYVAAIKEYEFATRLKPDFLEAFYNWGTNLGDLAKNKKGQEADDLYLQSFDKFQKATDINPDYHEAFFNWGTSLGHPR